jgi:hypothetical protein
MNDDELITVLREQRGKVVMTIPVEQIISRGRTVRARRGFCGGGGSSRGGSGRGRGTSGRPPCCQAVGGRGSGG